MSDIQLAQQIARELAPYLDGINSRLQRIIEFQILGMSELERMYAPSCATCGDNESVIEYYGPNGPHSAPCPDCQQERHEAFWAEQPVEAQMAAFKYRTILKIEKETRCGRYCGDIRLDTMELRDLASALYRNAKHFAEIGQPLSSAICVEAAKRLCENPHFLRKDETAV